MARRHRCRAPGRGTALGRQPELHRADRAGPRAARRDRPLLQEALSRYPDHPQLLWLHGQALVRDGRFADAVPVFEDLVAWRSRPRTTDGLLGVDERLFDFLPYERLATCYFRLGRYTEAERYFALAERWEPSQLEYKVKRQLCAKLARAEMTRPAPPTRPETGSAKLGHASG